VDRDTATGYGYGVHVGTLGGYRAVFHTGDIPGYRSLSAWLPEHEASVAILSHDEATDVELVLRGLLDDFAGWAASPRGTA
jgi:hypothetical protein